MASEKQYLSLYEQQKALICAGSCAPMNNRREEAAALLAANGLPTAKVERYKYTDVEAAFAPDPAPDPLSNTLSRSFFQAEDGIRDGSP